MMCIARRLSTVVPKLVNYTFNNPGKTTEARGQVVRAVSPELAKVIGSDKSTFRNAMSRIWVYIADRKLQDPKDKLWVLPDNDLKAVFPEHSKLSGASVSL
jgi:chromatin remodeling complex protein RSC6